jgi:hypothetical protein
VPRSSTSSLVVSTLASGFFLLWIFSGGSTVLDFGAITFGAGSSHVDVPCLAHSLHTVSFAPSMTTL